MTSARHHLIVRAEIRKPPTDPEAVKDWLRRLIDTIGMKLASGLEANPIAYYCDVAGNRGLTATAIIETSNVTLHTWDECDPAELQFDLFTCGRLNGDAVFAMLAEFEPTRAEFVVIDRAGGLLVTGAKTER